MHHLPNLCTCVCRHDLKNGCFTGRLHLNQTLKRKPIDFVRQLHRSVTKSWKQHRCKVSVPLKVTTSLLALFALATSQIAIANTESSVTLTSTNVEASTATLRIANHTGDWFHKHTTPSEGTCSTVVSAGTSTVDLVNLDSNTDYTWKAYSDGGCSAELASGEFLTKPGKPGKPNVTPGVANGELTLSASVTGNGSISKWQYQQKEGGNNFGSWLDFSDSGSSSLIHTLTDLTEGTNYQFKVRVVNATGNSTASDASDAQSPYFVSVTVSNVSATTATLTLSWSGAAEPKIQSYKSFSIPYSACTATKAATSISWNDLKSNTNYRFDLHKNMFCTDKLITAPRFKTFPGKPETPTVTTAGSGELVITSSVIGNPALDKWQYIKKEGTAEWESTWKDIAISSTKLSHTFPDLTNGTEYQFKVRAVNSKTSPEDFGGGTGAASDASTAVSPVGTTKPEPSLVASNITHDTATLTPLRPLG